jgi:outer membrane protein TolC
MKIVLITATIAALTVAPGLSAAQVRKLTMAEAVELALKQNHNMNIARFEVQEAQEKKASAKSQYFPTLSNETNLLHITNSRISISRPAALAGFLEPGHCRRATYSSIRARPHWS